MIILENYSYKIELTNLIFPYQFYTYVHVVLAFGLYTVYKVMGLIFYGLIVYATYQHYIA